VSEGDLGFLRQPITPFGLNCRAAGVLARLGQAAGRLDLWEHARVVLASQTNAVLSRGVEAAEYALALRAIGLSEPS